MQRGGEWLRAVVVGSGTSGHTHLGHPVVGQLERLGLPLPTLAAQPSDVVWVWCMKVVELSSYHWGGEKPGNLMFPKEEQV